MPRSRVLSFMSQWGAPKSPTLPSVDDPSFRSTDTAGPTRHAGNIDTTTNSSTKLDSADNPPRSPSGPSRARGDSKPPRPMSMLQSYNPPQVDVAQDTPPELQPIFSYLNSHSNKLYQEGYFLKLHDLDSRGRPSADRTWVESFAQLIGTVLSLWDANALDVAGEDGEVVPTFVNLSDASIKMIESLPMSGVAGGSLQNVLSISTAANNRYLLHFNSLSSLTQWTAGIRLAMFEHTTLQEAYTGSLIAGKGRYLNNIKQIMFRTQFAHEDWARVRFGAGTPWQRCWCVINPPDEKEYAKAQKTLKKSSSYERVRIPKGDIKFYDTRKVTKKTVPIATVTDAYAAYAIYPQSKPLIDQSTLVKLEGIVTMHSQQDSTSEGFVFVMPEVHAAVTGFEMMLRWLFPVYDTFALYGRPNKLIADTLDQRGLMFAMPRDRRYGYLDILDVSGLIHAKGSHSWSERHWRRELKKSTADRMMQQIEGAPSGRQSSQRRSSALSPSGGVRFGGGEAGYVRSTPGSRSVSPLPPNGLKMRTDSAPPGGIPSPHKRSVSEAQGLGYKKYQTETPSRLSYEAARPDPYEMPPAPPAHGGQLAAVMGINSASASSSRSRLERIQSEAEVPTMQSMNNQPPGPAAPPHLPPPEPVGAPPAFVHSANSRPGHAPLAPPELRRAQSNVDEATLYQMKEATRRDISPNSRGLEAQQWNGEVQQRQQNTVASQANINNSLEMPADHSQGTVNRKQRDPRQRLSTIPGSPFIGEGGPQSQSPVQIASPRLDGVPEASDPRPYDEVQSTINGAAPPVPLHSSQSIARKPVPGRALPTPPAGLERTLSHPSSAGSVVNEESWPGGMIDEAALERVLNAPDRQSTMQSTTTESTEPDYASTMSNTSKRSPKKSMERPRAGKLKTVGDPDIPTIDPRSGGVGRHDTWDADQAAQSSAAVPNVDFGPTYAYKPTSRPTTSGTLTPGDMAKKRRSRSTDRLTAEMMGGAIGVSPRPSPNESHRLSYFSNAGRTTPSPGRMTPEFGGPGDRTSGVWQGNSPSAVQRSRTVVTPEPGVAGDRNSYVWQPGAAPGPTHRSKTSLTPEEWVQQRATMAQQQPQYAAPRKGLQSLFHGRSNSAQGQRKLTKTPPPGRTLSGDWTQQVGRQTPPPRPSSRGAGANLDMGGSSLSAREQMQVSRATGSPLVNIANKSTFPAEQPGMIGYVAARERDKAASKEGRNSMAAQQAIMERQQQQRLEAEAQAQQQQYQYQMQMQAQQQQMGYNQMMMAQNQQMQYAQQQQQQQRRPVVQTANSWQSGYVTPGAVAPPGYAAANAASSPSLPLPSGYQQPYGAAYYQQHQQGQSPQGPRRY